MSAQSTCGRNTPLTWYSRRSCPTCGPSLGMSSLERSALFGTGTLANNRHGKGRIVKTVHALY